MEENTKSIDEILQEIGGTVVSATGSWQISKLHSLPCFDEVDSIIECNDIPLTKLLEHYRELLHLWDDNVALLEDVTEEERYIHFDESYGKECKRRIAHVEALLDDQIKYGNISSSEKMEVIQSENSEEEKLQHILDIFKEKVKPQHIESLNIILKYMEDSDLHKTNVNIGAVAWIVYKEGFMRKYINTYTKCLGLFESYFDIEIKDKRKSKYEKRANELRKTHAVIDNPTAEKAPYTRN